MKNMLMIFLVLAIIGGLSVIYYFLMKNNLYFPLCLFIFSVIVCLMVINSKEMKDSDNDDGVVELVEHDDVDDTNLFKD